LFQVNIGKAYAFAEFITPEDATTALGFDGVTLHGTILKIRRPKDFIAPEVIGKKLIVSKFFTSNWRLLCNALVQLFNVVFMLQNIFLF